MYNPGYDYIHSIYFLCITEHLLTWDDLYPIWQQIFGILLMQKQKSDRTMFFLTV